MRTGKLQSSAGYEHEYSATWPWSDDSVYYTPVAPTAFINTNLPSGRTIFQPFFVPPKGFKPNRLFLQVNPSAYSAGDVRLALYSDNTGRPDDLIEDLGSQSITTTGNKAFIPSFDVQPGRLWVAFNHTGTGAGQFRAFAYGALAGARGLIGAPGGLAAVTRYVDEDATSGFPASASAVSGSNDHWPIIWMTRV